MDFTTSSSPRRFGLTVVLLGAIAIAVALLAASAGPAHARNLRCSPMTAGHLPGAKISVYDVGPINMRCTSAEPIIRDFIDRKISQRDERCAGLAESPPYRGCIVKGFRCRATHRLERVNGRWEIPQLCSRGRRLIYFAEHDTVEN